MKLYIDDSFNCAVLIKDNNQVIELLGNEGIDCRPFFYPLSSLPAYQNLLSAHEARRRNHVSYQLSPYGVNLPSGMNMTAAKARYVSQTLNRIIGGGVRQAPPAYQKTAHLMEG